MSSLHHENILEDCFEVSMESFRINNKLTHEQLDELITISKGTYDAICSNAYKIFQIEGQEHLDVNIKNLDVESDINW